MKVGIYYDYSLNQLDTVTNGAFKNLRTLEHPHCTQVATAQGSKVYKCRRSLTLSV